MRLELLEKICDDQLAEVWIGRLDTVSGRELVTARRLLRQVILTEGVSDALAGASAILDSLNHDNLCRHIGFFEGNNDYYWLTGRTDGFDLTTVQKRLATREVHLSSLRSLQIGLDFIKGLRVLHDQGMVHGCLSPRYVLVGYDGVSRLDGAGFEGALLGCRELKQRARNGRASQLAPEVLQGRMPTPRSDVFSAAAVIYSLLTGRPPLEDNERSGAGMSVRHAGIQPPTKLDRTLPYSCDAVFEKALNMTPQGRHESGSTLFNAFKRLRSAMLKGPDEGRRGVQEFVEGLFPNEAIVPGKPGTIDRPPLGEEIHLVQVAARAEHEQPWAQDEDVAIVESRPQEPGEPVTVVDRNSVARQQPSQAESEALARIAAWEAAFGAPPGTGPEAGRPPPLPAKQEAPDPPRLPAVGNNKHTGSDSVVVDWTGLSGNSAGPPGTGGAGSDWDRIPTQVSAPPEEALKEAPEAPPDEEFVTEPELPIEVMDAEESEPPPNESEPPANSDDDDTLQVQSMTRDTTPQGNPPIETTRMTRSFWTRPVGLFSLLALAALVVVLVLAVSNSSSTSDTDAEGSPQDGDTTPVGFLSITTDKPARVTLDGELLPGSTPLTNKLVRAGQHRLVLNTADGDSLFDETITVEAGEHRTIRVVVAGAKATSTPQPATTIGEKKSPKVKSTRKKRTKKRKRRKKKIRTRNK